MAVKYHKDKEMILDCKRNDGYIVIDVPANGVLYLDSITHRWETLFPNLAQQYRAECMLGAWTPGEYKFYEEDGYRFILICTRWADFGQFVKVFSDVQASRHLMGALNDIRVDLGENERFISSFLGSRLRLWGHIHKEVESQFKNWNIYKR